LSTTWSGFFILYQLVIVPVGAITLGRILSVVGSILDPYIEIFSSCAFYNNTVILSKIVNLFFSNISKLIGKKSRVQKDSLTFTEIEYVFIKRYNTSKISILGLLQNIVLENLTLGNEDLFEINYLLITISTVLCYYKISKRCKNNENNSLEKVYFSGIIIDNLLKYFKIVLHFTMKSKEFFRKELLNYACIIFVEYQIILLSKKVLNEFIYGFFGPIHCSGVLILSLCLGL